MRITTIILLFVTLSAASAAVVSCRQLIGECNYGTDPEPCVATVASITSRSFDTRRYRVIRVKEFPMAFYLSEEEYRRCFIKAGYRVGSQIKARVLHGGPCPPIYYLEVCEKIAGVFDPHR